MRWRDGATRPFDLFMSTLISIFEMFKTAVGQIFTALSVVNIFGYTLLSLLVSAFVIQLFFNLFRRSGGVSIGSKDKGGKEE